MYVLTSENVVHAGCNNNAEPLETFFELHTSPIRQATVIDQCTSPQDRQLVMKTFCALEQNGDGFLSHIEVDVLRKVRNIPRERN